MKILIILYSIDRNGAPLFALDVCKILEELGHKCYVWSVMDGTLNDEFSKRYNLKIVDPYDDKLSNEIMRYDIAIMFTVRTFMFYETLEAKIPFFWYIHEGRNIEDYLENDRCNEVFLKAKNIFVVSEYVSNIFGDRYGKKVKVLHNFVKDECKIKELSLDQNKIKFFCSGSIIYRKGYDLLLDALNELDETKQKMIDVYVCGERDIKHPYTKDIVKQIESMSFVHDRGELSRQDAINLCDECDYVIVPSRDESFSLVAAEGAMLGKPLILSDNVGAKYLVGKDGGWIFESDNKNSLRLALEQAIKTFSDYSRKSKSIRIEYESRCTEKLYKKNISEVIRSLKIVESGFLRKATRIYKKYFCNPFYRIKLPYRSRIAIYGAGKYGKAWNYLLKKSRYYKVVAWIDKNPSIPGVVEIDDVDFNNVDYVIITINDSIIRREVKELLLSKGIKRESIIYQKECSNELEGY